MAPYLAKGKKKGEAPRVLAMSNGQGNFKKDFVYAVCLNQRGRLIDHERFEDIQFGDTKERLKEHIERLRPEVIVVGGFSPATKILKEQISYVLEHMVQIKPASVRDNEDRDQPTTALSGASSIEVIYVHDHVARSYQHSKRAMSEFAEITPVARYCIGLARYAQSPICEYAGLGSELSALSFDPDQKLVSGVHAPVAASREAIANLRRGLTLSSCLSWTGSERQTAERVGEDDRQCRQPRRRGHQQGHQRCVLQSPAAFCRWPGPAQSQRTHQTYERCSKLYTLIEHDSTTHTLNVLSASDWRYRHDPIRARAKRGLHNANLDELRGLLEDPLRRIRRR